MKNSSKYVSDNKFTPSGYWIPVLATRPQYCSESTVLDEVHLIISNSLPVEIDPLTLGQYNNESV